MNVRTMAILTGTLCLLTSLWLAATDADDRYRSLSSETTVDRQGVLVSVTPNSQQDIALYQRDYPDALTQFVLRKEDRAFFYHPGIDPLSIVRALGSALRGERAGGSSTITQQLAKNVLGNTSNRNLRNKIIELYYTLGMEIALSKDEILTRYLNTAYLGNGARGFASGALRYFGKDVDDLAETELFLLTASLSRPSTDNPHTPSGLARTRALASVFGLTPPEGPPTTLHPWHGTNVRFELASLMSPCASHCHMSIDSELTETIRTILREALPAIATDGNVSGAVVVIAVPSNEVLAVVGSPDPERNRSGAQINMAVEPRPIGSTVKPFIYLKGFESGLRPYSLVDDREYRYEIGTGFPIYPRNYDGHYRGIVTLHEALASSLNVPSVKVLEYVGLETFYRFLGDDLGFVPLQDLTEYELGIALGGLEMDLLTLTSLFTVFPNRGVLKPINLTPFAGERPSSLSLPMSTLARERRIVDSRYVDLVTSVLSDRYAGVEQFGLESNLNLPFQNYAVKTGTSRDYHDSWTIGYTPDFVVGVWIGRPDNTPLPNVSGSYGAGRVWHDVMTYLSETHYYTTRPFENTNVTAVSASTGTGVGLAADTITSHETLLLDDRLIRKPHHKDRIRFEPHTVITLRAREPATWFVNDEAVGDGMDVDYVPARAEILEIRAVSATHEDVIEVDLITP